MLGSLQLGWLNPFFFAAENVDVQGIDYFSLPKAYLNLLHGQSMFDTWSAPTYGPHATWYLSHPALAVFVGSWFSYFSPWVSYWLFTIFSVGLLVLAAWLLSRLTTSTFFKALMFPLILGSFTVYWMLYVGNVQAFLVLSLALVLAGLFALAFPSDRISAQQAKLLLALGLLVSFFSKPLVLFMLPMLLIIPATRKTTAVSIGIYAGVSFLFLIVPVFNPQMTGLERVFALALDPSYIKEHMNIYNNHFVLNADMKDNSMHWFNLIAQSDFYLNHIEVFSLSVFSNTIAGTMLPGWLFKIPILIVLGLSGALFFVKEKATRLKASIWITGAVICTFFLSYNTVWEYQYTAILPFVAILALLYERGELTKTSAMALAVLALFFYLPNTYIFFGNPDPDTTMLTVIRSTRVIPVLLLFVYACYRAVGQLRAAT